MSMDAYVLGALARGYCHRDNRHKVVDTELVEAMCSQVMKIVSASEARAEAAEAALELSRKLESEGYKALHYSEEATEIEQLKARAEAAEKALVASQTDRVRLWNALNDLLSHRDADTEYTARAALEAKP